MYAGELPAQAACAVGMILNEVSEFEKQSMIAEKATRQLSTFSDLTYPVKSPDCTYFCTPMGTYSQGNEIPKILSSCYNSHKKSIKKTSQIL
jgi:hypothetical protein